MKNEWNAQNAIWSHAYEPLGKSVNYVPPYMQRTTTVLVNGIPNQYNYGINTSEKKDDSITGTKYQAGAIPPSIPILYFVSLT